MTDTILFTSTQCPKCPEFRNLLRETAKEMGLKEGQDFVEKLIDGDKVETGKKTELEGEEYYIVSSAEDIDENKKPAALGGEDFSLEALQYQIASTPALVINGELAFVSEVPEKQKLKEKLRKIK